MVCGRLFQFFIWTLVHVFDVTPCSDHSLAVFIDFPTLNLFLGPPWDPGLLLTASLLATLSVPALLPQRPERYPFVDLQ